MAKQTINIGTAELAGDGETLRSAFDKVNDNFTELYNADAADITLASFSVGAEGTPSGDGSIAYDNTTGVFTYTPPAGGGGGGGGLSNVVDDTTPQLGGNLDMNGFEIVTTNGGHIRLDPDTTGGVGIGNVTNAATLLHLQQSAPIITLQRLDNTLSQGISWTGQNGVEAAHIKLDGTGGITNTLIMSAFDGSSVTERLRVMAAVGEGIKVTGDIEANKIKTTSGNTDIILETHGTGDVLLKGDKVGIGVVNQPDTTLHLKDTNSVITLQRTADANTPGLSFQNSGGNSRAELKMDGTSGTSNEVFIKTDNQDGAGLVERIRIGHTVNTSNNVLRLERGVHERFATLTGATGTVAHDCATGQIFYHTGAAANFTANFTNLTIAQEDATNIAIIINQGNTGYIPNAVQIGGAAQTIIWQGNSAPTATDNGTDSFSFTILNDGGTYVVLGQMVSFGGV